MKYKVDFQGKVLEYVFDPFTGRKVWIEKLDQSQAPEKVRKLVDTEPMLQQNEIISAIDENQLQQINTQELKKNKELLKDSLQELRIAISNFLRNQKTRENQEDEDRYSELYDSIQLFINSYLVANTKQNLNGKLESGEIEISPFQKVVTWVESNLFKEDYNKSPLPQIAGHEIFKIVSLLLGGVSIYLPEKGKYFAENKFKEKYNLNTLLEDLNALLSLINLVELFEDPIANEFIPNEFFGTFVSNTARGTTYSNSQIIQNTPDLITNINTFSVKFPDGKIINLKINWKFLINITPESLLFIRTFIFNAFTESNRSLNKELEIKAYIDPTKQWVIVEDNIQPTGNIDPETIFNSQKTTIDRLANDLCELNKDDISDDALLKAVIEKLDKLLLITSEGATKMAIYYYVKMFITKQEFADLTYEFLKLVKEKNLTQLTSFIKANIIDFISTNENGELKKQVKINARLAAFLG